MFDDGISGRWYRTVWRGAAVWRSRHSSCPVGRNGRGRRGRVATDACDDNAEKAAAADVQSPSPPWPPSLPDHGTTRRDEHVRVARQLTHTAVLAHSRYVDASAPPEHGGPRQVSVPDVQAAPRRPAQRINPCRPLRIQATTPRREALGRGCATTISEPDVRPVTSNASATLPVATAWQRRRSPSRCARTSARRHRG